MEAHFFLADNVLGISFLYKVSFLVMWLVYVFRDGTAVGGTELGDKVDYISQSGTLQFNHSETSKTVTIEINKNAKVIAEEYHFFYFLFLQVQTYNGSVWVQTLKSMNFKVLFFNCILQPEVLD